MFLKEKENLSVEIPAEFQQKDRIKMSQALGDPDMARALVLYGQCVCRQVASQKTASTCYK